MKLNYLNKLYKYLEIQLTFVLQIYCAGKLDKEISFRNIILSRYINNEHK